MMMDQAGMGVGGLLVMLVVAGLIVVPFWRLLPQFGIPKWGAVLAVFPLVALIFLWIMAFKPKKNDGIV